MELYDECRSCLYGSQMKKVERERGTDERFARFKAEVKKLCDEAPQNLCAPLLMRDIDGLHRKIFGCGIDYSKEKKLFNSKLLEIEERLYAEILSSQDPLGEAVKFAMAANYIDFARISDLNESAVAYVLSAAKRANPDGETLEKFKNDLKNAKTLCYLHDNCGEIVLDKILIRVIKKFYPQISVTSVVRGSAIINDVTEEDAAFTGLNNCATVINNGTNIPGTYLKEVSGETLKALKECDVIISKGLGNLETLYGEVNAYFVFTCKCAHIAKRFGADLWSAVFTS